MSPISDAIERLAASSGRDLLDLFELWLERASIREYCAGMGRDAAEEAALDDVRQIVGLTSQQGRRAS